MINREVDVAIIGAGTAGLNARREIEKAGLRPLLIESGPYGTTCARVGCMPSKLLIAAADAAHHAGKASMFGVDTTVSVDGITIDRCTECHGVFVEAKAADELLKAKQETLHSIFKSMIRGVA